MTTDNKDKTSIRLVLSGACELTGVLLDCHMLSALVAAHNHLPHNDAEPHSTISLQQGNRDMASSQYFPTTKTEVKSLLERSTFNDVIAGVLAFWPVHALCTEGFSAISQWNQKTFSVLENGRIIDCNVPLLQQQQSATAGPTTVSPVLPAQAMKEILNSASPSCLSSLSRACKYVGKTGEVKGSKSVEPASIFHLVFRTSNQTFGTSNGSVSADEKGPVVITPENKVRLQALQRKLAYRRGYALREQSQGKLSQFASSARTFTAAQNDANHEKPATQTSSRNMRESDTRERDSQCECVIS